MLTRTGQPSSSSQPMDQTPISRAPFNDAAINSQYSYVKSIRISFPRGVRVGGQIYTCLSLQLHT